MAEFPLIPKDYLTTSFLAELKQYIDDKAAEGGGGAGSSGLVVNITEEEGTHDLVADKTWQEMWDAAEAGGYITVHVPASETYETDESYTMWTSVGTDGVDYFFDFNTYWNAPKSLTADSADGYPRLTADEGLEE